MLSQPAAPPSEASRSIRPPAHAIMAARQPVRKFSATDGHDGTPGLSLPQVAQKSIHPPGQAAPTAVHKLPGQLALPQLVTQTNSANNHTAWLPAAEDAQPACTSVSPASSGGALLQAIEQRDQTIAWLQRQVAHLRAALSARMEDVRLYQNKLDALGTQLGGARQGEEDRVQQLASEAAAQLERSADELRRVRVELQAARDELDRSRQQANHAHSDNAALRAELEAAHAQLQRALARAQQLDAEVQRAHAQAHSSVAAVQRDLAAERSTSEQLRLQLDESVHLREKHELGEHRNLLHASEAHEQARQAAERAQAAEERATEARAEIETLRRERAEAASAFARLHEEHAALGSRLAAAEGSSQQLQAALAQLSAEERFRAHALAEQLRRMSGEVASAQHGHAMLAQLRLVEAAEVHELQQRLHALERSTAVREGHLQGLAHGARALRNELDGSAALLAPAQQRPVSLAPAGAAFGLGQQLQAQPLYMHNVPQPLWAAHPHHLLLQPQPLPHLPAAQPAPELHGPVGQHAPQDARATDEMIAAVEQQLSGLAPPAAATLLAPAEYDWRAVAQAAEQAGATNGGACDYAWPSSQSLAELGLAARKGTAGSPVARQNSVSGSSPLPQWRKAERKAVAAGAIARGKGKIPARVS